MRLSVGSVRPLSIRWRAGPLFTGLRRGAQRKAGPGQKSPLWWGGKLRDCNMQLRAHVAVLRFIQRANGGMRLVWRK